MRETTSSGHYLFWPVSAQPIQYLLDDTPAGDGASANGMLVIQQFEQWMASSCAEIAITTTPGTLAHANAQATMDGTNEIFWTTTWPPSNCPTCSSAILGLTTPWFDDTTGAISDADIQFNASDFPKWEDESQYNGCTASQGGCADTASIALHEEGHFLGLGHTPISSAIMYAVWDGTPKRQLTTDDLSGVCAIYPQTTPGTGPQGSGCVLATDCMSVLTCSTPLTGGGSICTKGCSGSSDMSCPTGGTCQAISSTAFGCFPPPVGTSPNDATLGQDCTSTNVMCETGLVCASAGGGDFKCDRQCAPQSAATGCLPDQICEAFLDGADAGACVDNPTYGASLGQSCETIVCQGELVCFGPDPTNSVCSTPCDPTDGGPCASGLVCLQAGNEQGACAPGPVAACGACGSMGNCGSTLTCMVFSAGVDICRAGCERDSDCSNGGTCLSATTFIGTGGVCSCPIDLGETANGSSCIADEFCVSGSVCVPAGSPSGNTCEPSCGPHGTCAAGMTCTPFLGKSACVTPSDGGLEAGDGGTGNSGGSSNGGCGCSSGDPASVSAFLFGLAGLTRRRPRRCTAGSGTALRDRGRNRRRIDLRS